MNLFKSLSGIMDESLSLQFTVKKKNGNFIVGVFTLGEPGSKTEKMLQKIAPITISGSAEEIDAQFMDLLQAPIELTQSLLKSNVAEVVKSITNIKEDAAIKAMKVPQAKAEPVKAVKEKDAATLQKEAKKQSAELIAKAAAHAAKMEHELALPLYRQAKTLDSSNKYLDADIAKCQMYVDAATKAEINTAAIAPITKAPISTPLTEEAKLKEIADASPNIIIAKIAPVELPKDAPLHEAIEFEENEEQEEPEISQKEKDYEDAATLANMQHTEKQDADFNFEIPGL